MISHAKVDENTAPLLCDLQSQWKSADPSLTVEPLPAVADSLLRNDFRHRQRLFLAHNPSGQCVAHTVARLSPRLTDEGGRPIGTVGFFQCLANECPIELLMNSTRDWFHEQNVRTIVGPMDGDTWHRYRWNLGPWETPPFPLEPTNPPSYPQLWQAWGWQVIDRYHSKIVDDLPHATAALYPGYDAARRRGYRFRQFDPGQFESELDLLYDLTVQSYDGSPFFEIISRHDFHAQYETLRGRISPRVIWFATTHSGQPVGYLFAWISQDVPIELAVNAGQVERSQPPCEPGAPPVVNFKTLGVLPDHRRQGLAAALMFHGLQVATELGAQQAQLCLIRDGNPSSRLDGGRGQVFRRYALYQMPGGHFHVPND